MACQGLPKMSLVAQYDDLCRNTKVLTTGSEEEFKMFIESQLNCMRKWRDVQSEVRGLKEKVGDLEGEKRRLLAQMKNLRCLLEDEINRRKKVEEERKSMERQIALIKEVLLADGNMDNQTKEKLAFLSSTNAKANVNSPTRLTTIEESVGSLLSISDVDRTDDSLEDRGQSSRYPVRRSRGKRSSPENRSANKKHKSDENSGQNEETDTCDSSDVPFKNVGYRSKREQVSNIPNVPTFSNHAEIDADQLKFNTLDLRRQNTGSLSMGTPVGRYSTGGKLSRTHLFVTKTVVRPEKCTPCGHNIKFSKQALKCRDCRVVCHPECKDKCPVPCIPTVNTPTKSAAGTIADYVSATAPMIPSIIVHCVNEIESRGLHEIGLYRISGSEKEVKDLKEKFLRGRTIPCLNKLDIHAICGTVKEFLRSLEEPLITRSSWKIFVEAAEISNRMVCLSAIYEAVMDLPQPNKDTLAFLVLHLQKIAESPACKMPKENLAKVFGPTIVGYSQADPARGDLLNETSSQYQVMLRLLEISSDSWQNMLNVESDSFKTMAVKTPETIPAPRETRLGPIYASGGQRLQSKTPGRTPVTPRNSRFSRTGKMQFQSPFLR